MMFVNRVVECFSVTISLRLVSILTKSKCWEYAVFQEWTFPGPFYARFGQRIHCWYASPSCTIDAVLNLGYLSFIDRTRMRLWYFYISFHPSYRISLTPIHVY